MKFGNPNFWSTETCGIDKLDLSKHSYGKLNLAYNENIIKELLSFADYSKLTEEKVMKYMDFLLTEPLTEENIDKFREIFD